MVERVAKAIHTLRHNTPEQQARAAIAEMRKPTQEMIAARPAYATSAEARMWWLYFIDAALK